MSRLVVEVTTGTKNCAFFFCVGFSVVVCAVGCLFYTFVLVGFFFLQVYASCEGCFASESNAKKKEQNDNKRALAEHFCLLCVFFFIS